jgi:hypothetical protein
VRLTIPQPAAPEVPRESARLNLPETPPPPPAKPAVVDERALTPSLPTGISQFSKPTEQVATGQKPHLDGLDWLQKNGYRTVLHLHPQGEVAADRGQVEKRNLKYVSLAVAADSLTPKVLDDFKRIVEDPSGHPLFIYDEDGTLTGGLWYLYLRTVVKENDDAAREKAVRVGLKPEHQAMWSALKKFLDSTLDK